MRISDLLYQKLIVYHRFCHTCTYFRMKGGEQFSSGASAYSASIAREARSVYDAGAVSQRSSSAHMCGTWYYMLGTIDFGSYMLLTACILAVQKGVFLLFIIFRDSDWPLWIWFFATSPYWLWDLESLRSIIVMYMISCAREDALRNPSHDQTRSLLNREIAQRKQHHMAIFLLHVLVLLVFVAFQVLLTLILADRHYVPVWSLFVCLVILFSVLALRMLFSTTRELIHRKEVTDMIV